MAGINASAIKAVDNYKKQVLAEIEKNAISFCNALCQAAIIYRKHSGGHDFTGNLLNSIVVCLYKERSPIYACYAADRVTKAIRVKMTNYMPPWDRVFFKQDYEGHSGTKYKPEVPTHYGWGEDDAKMFFNSYRPSGHHIFDIVVAYPTEYAEWIEVKRKTTGILQTYDYAERTGTTWLQLPQSGTRSWLDFS